MLRVIWKSLSESGWQVVNVDCVVVLERPRLAPYKQLIRETLAAILGIGPDRINVKAKTAEGVGPAGEGKMIEAHVVCPSRKRRRGVNAMICFDVHLVLPKRQSKRWGNVRGRSMLVG